MKFAYYPGCAAKATAPEVDQSTRAICRALGIELVAMPDAPCCGAGVVQARDPLLTDTLNARTFTIAEKQGLDIVTICGTCTGYMRKAKRHLEDDDHRATVNKALAEGGAEYQGTTDVSHLLWILDKNADKVSGAVKRALTRGGKPIKVAPYYGCHLLRPRTALGHDNPDNPQSLERVIRLLGGEPVDYSHRTRCCGFPLQMEREEMAFTMTAESVASAHLAEADVMVTPCPLCHLNLDMQQERAVSATKGDNSMVAKMGNNRVPVLHIAQLVGIALGIDASELGLSRHFVDCSPLLRQLDKIAA